MVAGLPGCQVGEMPSCRVAESSRFFQFAELFSIAKKSVLNIYIAFLFNLGLCLFPVRTDPNY